MSANRLIHFIGLVSLLGSVGVEARAEPMLLLELHRHGFQTFVSSGQPVLMEFSTQITDSTTRTVFGGSYTDADEGMMFDAPADLVDRFEAALTAPTGRFWLSGGGTTPIVVEVDSIWNPIGAYTPTPHVPRLGHGLTGYNLTRVARTIGQLDYFIQPGPSGGPTAEMRQTISLYWRTDTRASLGYAIDRNLGL
jgi:hypothetical protein